MAGSGIWVVKQAGATKSEAHLVGQFHIGQADPDVRSNVQQSLATNHPLARVRHQPTLPR